MRRTVGVYAIGVWVDEINGDPKVWFREEIMLMLFLKRGGFILYKPYKRETGVEMCLSSNGQ